MRHSGWCWAGLRVLVFSAVSLLEASEGKAGREQGAECVLEQLGQGQMH